MEASSDQFPFNENAALKKIAEDALDAYVEISRDFRRRLEKAVADLKDAYESKIEKLTEANQGMEKELTGAYATISNLMKEDDEFKRQNGILWGHAMATLADNEAKRAIVSNAVSGLAKQLEQRETHLEIKTNRIEVLEKDNVLLKSQLSSVQTSVDEAENKLQLADHHLDELDEKWKKENEKLKTQIEKLTRKLKESETPRKRSANGVEPKEEEELDQFKENEGIEGEPPSKKVKTH
ncbi:hypothetical protein CAEBREN_06952 [Caenorhabditis brenneri]|uniref:Uncharacterized protein n=1 Tax=Caenorhabditis brenneri TaxID=135651 RepID=G0MMM6_CAEBE|nr:hypothetical protein CAEBREN_06952 [Caenorhabditis brenneri]